MKDYIALLGMLFLILLALFLMIGPFIIPCRYLGWVSVKDIPARCLTISK
jgi:uncharacterized integral membrane protein